MEKETKIKIVKKLLFSYEEFYYFAYPLIEQDPLIKNWHIKVICDELQKSLEDLLAGKPKEGDIIINIPFRSSKSLITSVIFPVYCWLRNASLRIATVSYSQSLSVELTQKSRDIISNPKFQELFGEFFSLKIDNNKKNEYANNQKGIRYATSPEGTFTGKGYDIIIYDDIQNPKEADSKSAREGVINWHRGTGLSRLNRPKIGFFVNVQQRLHPKDLTGYFLSTKKNYKHIEIPAMLEIGRVNKYADYYTNGLFWESRWDWDIINDYRKELGSKTFSNQLQQKPYDDEGGLIKKEWITYYNPTQVNVVKHFFLDTAATSKTKNDATAIVLAYIKDNNLHIERVWNERLEYPDLVNFIKNIANVYGSKNSKFYIEPKSTGQALIPDLRRQTSLNIVEAKNPTTDKYSRISIIAPKFEAKRVLINIDNPTNNELIEQLVGFPNTSHDDMIDAIEIACNVLFASKSTFKLEVLNLN